MTQQLQGERRNSDKMDDYFIIFITVPIILPVIPAVIAGLVGWYVLKPDKMVRIMFPYIRRNSNNTVMFGFILKEYQIYGLFWGVIGIIYQVILTFWLNILIYKNSFSDASVELQCFYCNSTIAELTVVERLELDKDITCYAINYNIAGAMGQATGALALGWVIFMGCIECELQHHTTYQK